MPVDTSRQLLRWYDHHARVLPWRSPPGQPPPTPYLVWLSEIMLQQTGTASVTGYFNAFTRRWPSIEALAAAADADVMQAWAGLGYYARARNLLACARQISTHHGGQFPMTEAQLHQLPGIGPYTAAAISAIAFGQHAVVVDGNVERVISRYFAVAEALPAAKPILHARAANLTPAQRAGDHAQAMMDLGATICTPRNPGCGGCPIANGCVANQLGIPTAFPVKAPKRPRPPRYGTAYWLECDGAVLLVERPSRGLLGGMRALPSDIWAVKRPRLAPPVPAQWLMLPTPVRHVFTHFDLDLHLAVATVRTRPDIAGQWHPITDLPNIGLPSLFTKAVQHILANRRDHAPLSPAPTESTA
jgi:A/G-specific adenine glycosylase